MENQQNTKDVQIEEILNKHDLEELKLSLIKLHLEKVEEHTRLMKILEELLKE
jgi:hypothetical protein